MLVLTRKVGEQILIGNDVCLTVLEVRGNQMRLGITAPKDVPILRAEIAVRPKPAKPQPSAAPQRHIEPQPDVIVTDNTCGMPA